MKTNRVLVIILTILLPLSVLAVTMAQEVETAPDGAATPATIGGPDHFGYTFADSTEPTCAYQFVDISLSGSRILTGNDYSSASPPPYGIGAAYALSKTFIYYGRFITQMVMASNGYLTNDPDDRGPDFSNDCPLPAVPSVPPGTTGGRFYPLHDDLVLDGGDSAGYVQYFSECPRPGDVAGSENCTIFQWNKTRHHQSTFTFTFQAILYHASGEIVYQYDDQNPEAGSGSTTGIQNYAPPTTGLTYACDQPASIVDNSAVCFFPPVASILLTKTVSLNPACDDSHFLRILAGANAYFCYQIRNTGDLTFTQHTLQDSQLGILLSDFSYALLPGASTFYVSFSPTVITESVTNRGEWLAEYLDVDAISADKAIVIVDGPATNLSCNGPIVNFNNGVPANWLILSHETKGPVWSDLPGCEEGSNYTGSNGDLLCMSSNRYGAAPYNGEIWSNPFDIPDEPLVTLRYLANYQDLSAGDRLHLDISTDGGNQWTALLTWGAGGDDHGSFRNPPGEIVTVDLSTYAGSTGVLLRWHLYNPLPGSDFDGYAQVDDVSLFCGDYQLYLPISRKS